MIEKTVYDYLSGCLSVPVMMELPEVPSEDYPTFPEEFVVLEKVAGSVTDHINFATIAIQSYNTKSIRCGITRQTGAQRYGCHSR